MTMTTHGGTEATAIERETGYPSDWPDPMAPDEVGDDLVVMTRRGLARIAMAAARTGARFERDGDGLKAVEWLVEPRRAFDGRSALDACSGLLELNRCLSLHACGDALGDDADPDFLDDLASDEEAADQDGDDVAGTLDGATVAAAGDGPVGRSQRYRGMLSHRTYPIEELPSDIRPQVYSCTITHLHNGARFRVFAAAIAFHTMEFRARVLRRYGAMASMGSIRRGFDMYDPVVVELLSEDLANWLAAMAAAPSHISDGGLDVVVEKRLPA